jgi:KaiC/GvpD/RAD55 family RecA-like ATPase
LDDLKKSYVLLALIKVKEYSATNIELIKFFVEKKIPGIFVTINKPLEDLAMDIPKDYLESQGIYFIDCISKMSGAAEMSGKNFFCVESPNQLVELSEMLKNVVSKIQSEEKFIVIDSISTLLIYNKPEVVEKFVHSIAGKMRVWKVKGVLIMVESSETKPIAETLGQFCDHVVEID